MYTNFFKNLSHKKSGFTVLETLFALVIFSISLVTLMTIAGRGLSATTSSYELLVANYLNQESIETVRYVRDTNFITIPTPVSWLSGLDNCIATNPCELVFPSTSRTPIVQNCNNRSGCAKLYEGMGTYDTVPSPGITRPTSFVRSIVVLPVILTPTGPVPIGTVLPPTEAVVTSTITWNSKGINRQVSHQTILHKWR